MNSNIDKQSEIQALAIVTPDEGPSAEELQEQADFNREARADYEAMRHQEREFKPMSSEVFEPDAHDWS